MGTWDPQLTNETVALSRLRGFSELDNRKKTRPNFGNARDPINVQRSISRVSSATASLETLLTGDNGSHELHLRHKVIILRP